MLDKAILPQSARPSNGQPTLQARAFIVAFIPEQTQLNITQTWIDATTETVKALIYFRSALHRWQAAGKVDPTEWESELATLHDHNLGAWLDELIAAGMVEAMR